MKILVAGSPLHYHVPWMSRLERFTRAQPQDVQALILTGDVCNVLMSRSNSSRQCETIRAWLTRMSERVDIYYAPGAYDPDGLLGWRIDRLHGPGCHIQDGWRIHVMSAHRPGDEILPVGAQTIIVSDMPPAMSRTGVRMDGEHVGLTTVREAIVTAGDCRLCIHGGCPDPLSRVDYAEGSMVINVGLPFREHVNDDEPSFAVVDCDRRSVNLFDGQRVIQHSFAREL